VDLWTTPLAFACGDGASDGVAHNSTGASSAEGTDITLLSVRQQVMGLCRMTRFHRGVLSLAHAPGTEQERSGHFTSYKNRTD